MAFSTTPPQTDAGETYDYIIAGAGCAGLSLLMRMLATPGLQTKKILLVDKDAKKQNDRTWCFWEKVPGFFEPVVYKQWDNLWFHSQAFSRQLKLQPYTYKLIRGLDFYNHCFNVIRQHSNVTFLQQEISNISNNEKEEPFLIAADKRYKARYIFTSILFKKPILKNGEHWLLQHFTGWVIETLKPAFNPAEGTLMDFRTGQEEGASFFYVLPFSPTRALVEYTLFSEKVLQKEQYEKSLHAYIREHLGIPEFEITEREFGVIPMTDHRFPERAGSVIYLGTAGGQTKASSGYTFQFIQKHSQALVNSLVQHDHPFAVTPLQKKFRFYDSVLLKVLHRKLAAGDAVFSNLFRKNAPASVFKFLDNETADSEDIKLISTLPFMPFLKAAFAYFKK